MFGILATIISAKKHHAGYAIFTGIWTGLAVILALCGYSKMAIGPGAMFFVIALTMKDPEKQLLSPVKSDGDIGYGDKDKSKKFYCKNCSMFSSGWYQVCPNCGNAGSMVKTTETILFREWSKKQNQVTANTSSIQESTKSSAIPLPDPTKHSTETNLPVQFCRNCGAKLNPNAKYCLNCGTKTVVVNQEASVERSFAESTAETKPNSPDPTLLKLDLQDKNLPPLLRRAFLFIEDGEWEKADEYLEKVLDEDPENAYAYLGKLLVEYKLENAIDIRSIMPQAKNSKNYEKALRFADEKIKNSISELGAEEKATEDSVPCVDR